MTEKIPMFNIAGTKHLKGTDKLVWVTGKKSDIEKALRIFKSKNERYDWYFLVDRDKANELIAKRIEQQNNDPQIIAEREKAEQKRVDDYLRRHGVS